MLSFLLKYALQLSCAPIYQPSYAILLFLVSLSSCYSIPLFVCSWRNVALILVLSCTITVAICCLVRHSSPLQIFVSDGDFFLFSTNVFIPCYTDRLYKAANTTAICTLGTLWLAFMKSAEAYLNDINTHTDNPVDLFCTPWTICTVHGDQMTMSRVIGIQALEICSRLLHLVSSGSLTREIESFVAVIYNLAVEAGATRSAACALMGTVWSITSSRPPMPADADILFGSPRPRSTYRNRLHHHRGSFPDCRSTCFVLR